MLRITHYLFQRLTALRILFSNHSRWGFFNQFGEFSSLAKFVGGSQEVASPFGSAARYVRTCRAGATGGGGAAGAAAPPPSCQLGPIFTEFAETHILRQKVIVTLCICNSLQFSHQVYSHFTDHRAPYPRACTLQQQHILASARSLRNCPLRAHATPALPAKTSVA